MYKDLDFIKQNPILLNRVSVIFHGRKSNTDTDISTLAPYM